MLIAVSSSDCWGKQLTEVFSLESIIFVSNYNKVTFTSFTKGIHKNYRHMQVGRNLQQSSCSAPCWKWVQLHPFAPGCVQSSCEHLQERSLRSLSGHPATVPDCSHLTSFFFTSVCYFHFRSTEYHITPQCITTQFNCVFQISDLHERVH